MRTAAWRALWSRWLWSVATERGSVFYDLTGADAALEISTDVLGPVVITSKDPTTRDTAYGLFGDLVACVLGGR